MERRTKFTLKLVAGAQALLFASTTLSFAAFDAATGLTITKMEVVGGQLVVTGKTKGKKQTLRLWTAPYAAKTAKSNAKKAFKLSIPAIPGVCKVSFRVGVKVSVPQTVTGCGPVGPGVTAKGDWNALSAYVANDLVTLGGSVYRAKAANKNVSPVPVTPTGPWALFVASGGAGIDGVPGLMGPSGIRSVGDFNAQNAYLVGDVVRQLGSAYRASVDAPAGVPGEAGSQWDLLVSQGAVGPAGPAGPVGVEFKDGGWANGAAYLENDIVTHIGSTYRATAATTNQEPGSAGAPWQVVALRGDQGPSGVGNLVARGAWTATPAEPYVADNVVTASGAAWRAVVALPNPNIAPGAGTLDWELFVGRGEKGNPGDVGPAGPQGAAGVGNLMAVGPWNAAINFNVNDLVTHNGSSWWAQLDPAVGQEPGVVGLWQIFAARGDIGPAGDDGEDGAQGEPGPQGNPGIGNLVVVGTWQAGGAYALNNLVTHQGSLWRANVTPAATEPADGNVEWQLLVGKGEAGEQGAAGQAGLLATVAIGGGADETALNTIGGGFLFVGPTTQVTVTANQRITMTASVPIKSFGAGSIGVDMKIGACLQQQGGAIAPLGVTGNFPTQFGQQFTLQAAWSLLSVSGTGNNTAAATYTVGPCIASTNAASSTVGRVAGVVTVSAN